MCTTNAAGNLPALVLRNGVAWDKYEAVLFNHFCEDFISNKLVIGGQRIGIEKEPATNGRHRTFWHLISDGPVEPERDSDPCRCERIRWPRHMIERAPQFKSWRNERGSRKNILIATEDFKYVVVLAERKGYYFLWTAYCVEFESRRDAFSKEHATYQEEKAKARPAKG